MGVYEYKYRYKFAYDPGLETLYRQEGAADWCKEQFGDPYGERWAQYIDGFYFNHECDYLLFMLRWS